MGLKQKQNTVSEWKRYGQNCFSVAKKSKNSAKRNWTTLKQKIIWSSIWQLRRLPIKECESPGFCKTGLPGFMASARTRALATRVE